MLTADFDYELPGELIAQQPAEPRDSARLMVVRKSAGTIEHRAFRELPELLNAGDLLVVNDTRVMAARIFGVRPETGGAVEALLLRHTGDDAWEMLFRPARRAIEGRTFVFTVAGVESVARVVARDGARVTLQFDRPIDAERAGVVPLPPYITEYRGPAERYQTVYAREPRSAAAPTAGLHFTDELFERLRVAGVVRAAVTLDVGAGTFVPVAADDPREHVMHSEHITVPAATADAIHRAQATGGRVVAVGTTVVRTLEHVAAETGGPGAYDGRTALKILPGHEFRAVDVMITNFHLPRSTLLMLVSAFAGHALVMEAYRQAVAEQYRFYSFGDAMLLLP
ncbi:MAG: tRNA preQ1(34) S-adenosylmethionine ribosyltransferase-isomerase QueA [Dehalococcoidia bacterium]